MTFLFCHNFVFILWEFHTVHYYISFLPLKEILHIIFYILGLIVSYGILVCFLCLFVFVFLDVDCLQNVHGSWYDPLVLLRCGREFKSWGLVAELCINVEMPLDWLERFSPLLLLFSGSLVKQWMSFPYHFFLPRYTAKTAVWAKIELSSLWVMYLNIYYSTK